MKSGWKKDKGRLGKLWIWKLKASDNVLVRKLVRWSSEGRTTIINKNAILHPLYICYNNRFTILKTIL